MNSKQSTYHDILAGLFLAGKTLKSINFPQDWQYDFDRSWWWNKKYTYKNIGTNKECYIYLTDELLSELSIFD